VNPLDLTGPVGAVAGHIQVARWIAGASFFALLLALSFGFLRAKKQVLHDEAEAALEADFLRLERESALDDAAPPVSTREGPRK
jgi:hypothetical protein